LLAVSDLLALSQYAASLGIGFGGPDILSPSIGEGVSYGSQIEVGAGVVGGNNFGTKDYRGTIPFGYQQQQGAYISGASASDIEGYAYNNLAATHTIWEDDSSNSSATLTWAAVVAQLQLENFRIHSACPTSYTHGCNAQ